jgi:hypothetical protein
MATKPLKIPAPGQSPSTLELFGVSKNVNNIIGDAALLGTGGTLALFGTGATALGTTADTTAADTTAADTTAADTTAADTTAAKTAAGGAGAGTALGQLTKAATTGAVLSDLISGHYFKYAAIWTGLLVLGIGLILLGLSRNGVRTPVPIVVPA